MNLSDVKLPGLDLTSAQRETLEKVLPLVVVAILVWFAARGLRKMFWTAFGLFWAFGGWHSLRHLIH
ncbi:MAG TPA: hypothetical protein VKB52_15210 [Rhodanobacteraceae bacterium]|nr:hypothetical protein [Rhodanobacteraceae bacterium]